MIGKKIGITGADSFIGRALTSKLREEGTEIIPFTGDILNPRHVFEFFQSCDVIFHLANQNRGEDIDVYRISAIGGANVASAAVALGNRHVIYPSSIHVDKRPDSAYSKGKLEAERMLTDIAGIRGCKSSIFRLSNVFGPGALPFYVSVVATFSYYKAHGREDEIPITGDGSQIVELVPVSAVADAFLGALVQEEQTKLSYVNGQEMSVSELADIIRDDDRVQAFPEIAECIKIFEKKLPGILIQSGEMAGRKKIGSLSVAEVPCGLSKPQYRSPISSDWVFLVQGRLVVDFYGKDGSYLNSTLLENQRTDGVSIEGGYQYVIRSAGADNGLAVILHESS